MASPTPAVRLTGDAKGARSRLDVVGRRARGLTGNRHRRHSAREGSERPQKILGRPRVQHADHKIERPVGPAFGHAAERDRSRLVVAAIDPKLPTIVQAKPGYALKPARPARLHESLGDCGASHIEAGEQPGADCRKRRVFHLMRAGETGQRVAPFTAGVLHDQARGGAIERPLPTQPCQRRTRVGGDTFDDRTGLRMLAPDHAGRALLQDSGLLGGDEVERLAQIYACGRWRRG